MGNNSKATTRKSRFSIVDNFVRYHLFKTLKITSFIVSTICIILYAFFVDRVASVFEVCDACIKINLLNTGFCAMSVFFCSMFIQEKHKNDGTYAYILNYKLKKKELELKYCESDSIKLARSHLQIKFLTSVFTSVIFLILLFLYWKYQDIFVIKIDFKSLGIQNDFCKLILILLSKIPIMAYLFVGLGICKRAFTLWDEKIELNALIKGYKNHISNKNKQDDLLISLAHNYFGAKNGKKIYTSFFDKLLAKITPNITISQDKTNGK